MNQPQDEFPLATFSEATPERVVGSFRRVTPLHLIEISNKSSVAIFRALASESRAKILELLSERDLNINELSSALGLAQPSISKHIQILEEAGLIGSDYLAGPQGMQKRCYRLHDRITAEINARPGDTDFVTDISVPVGMYTDANVKPTCGLSSRERVIGLLDDPLSFSFAERSTAEIIWIGEGHITYAFPNTLPEEAEILSVELSVEISSEAPGYSDDFPSDITFWVNGVEVGTWTSPGDPGSERGRLNPPWWTDYMNQFGYFKTLRFTPDGTYLDDELWSEVTLADTKIAPRQATLVKFGIKPNAVHKGGMTLFGRGFGNHDQDILLRIHHLAKGEKAQL